MQNVHLVIAIVLTLTLGGMIADASRYTARQISDLHQQTDGQPELIGADAEYQHGTWCVDTRSF